MIFTNISDAPVTVSVAGRAPSGPFTAAQGCQGQTLAPGASCDFVFGFAPTVVGAATGSSNFDLNGVGFTIALSGTGTVLSPAVPVPTMGETMLWLLLALLMLIGAARLVRRGVH